MVWIGSTVRLSSIQWLELCYFGLWTKWRSSHTIPRFVMRRYVALNHKMKSSLSILDYKIGQRGIHLWRWIILGERESENEQWWRFGAKEWVRSSVRLTSKISGIVDTARSGQLSWTRDWGLMAYGLDPLSQP
jgi:hypothetical protein